MKNLQRVFVLLLAVCLLASISVPAFAAPDKDAKFVDMGNGFSYYFDEATGVLIIKGAGVMPVFDAAHPAPWAQFAASITRVIIDEGVTPEAPAA